MRERHGERTFKCDFCGANIKPSFEIKCVPLIDLCKGLLETRCDVC